MWRKGNPFVLLVGTQIGAATVESSMNISQKIKKYLPFDPVIPLLGIYPKKPKTLIWKNISTPMFIAALFTITKIWKQLNCPSDEWTKQRWDIYTMEYYSAVKKKKILPFSTAWMDLDNIKLSEISQSEKNKHHMISLMWNQMNKLNKQNRDRLKDRKQNDSYGEVGGWANRKNDPWTWTTGWLVTAEGSGVQRGYMVMEKLQ